MSVRRKEHTPRGDRAHEAARPPAPAVPPASGVVRREELEAELYDVAPPWTVVHAYLARGEHHRWVEHYASRSRAFAEVLEALRNDHEERREGRTVTDGARAPTPAGQGSRVLAFPGARESDAGGSPEAPGEGGDPK